MTDAFLKKAAEQALLGAQVMAQAAGHLSIIMKLFRGPRLAWQPMVAPDGAVSFQAQHGLYQFLVVHFELEGHEGLPYAGTAVAGGPTGPLIVNLPKEVAQLGFENACKTDASGSQAFAM